MNKPIFLFHALCCERYYFVFKSLSGVEDGWIESLLTDFRNMIEADDYSIDKEAVAEGVRYPQAKFASGGAGYDFYISLIDMLQYLEDSSASQISELKSDQYLFGDLISYLVSRDESVPDVFTMTIESRERYESNPIYLNEVGVQQRSRLYAEQDNKSIQLAYSTYANNPIL